MFEQHHPIRVGVLSRLPLSDVAQVSEFPEPLAPVQVDDDGNTIDAMGRGALRVRVAAGAHQLDVVTCHLKSKLLSFPRRRFQPRDEGEPLHARLSRATGADRPHPRQPRTCHAAAGRRYRRRATTIDHRDTERAPRRARIRPRTASLPASSSTRHTDQHRKCADTQSCRCGLSRIRDRRGPRGRRSNERLPRLASPHGI